MIIAGVNTKTTHFGKSLRDGGAAIVVDNELVYASNEERHSRIKADGGYEKSLEVGLRYLNLPKEDKLFLTSCCEPLAENQKDGQHLGHHLSHAALAFYTSGFSDSLIIVADAGGNVLSFGDDTEWWNQPREQLSIFHGQGDSITLLDREFSTTGACGFGEFFRAFTHLLGWPSARHAGKLMALAAWGRVLESSRGNFFEVDSDGKLRARADFFDPRDPVRTAHSFLRSIGREDLILSLKQNVFETKAEIAALVQRALEQNMVRLCEKWLLKLKTKNICLAGGIAMNCTMALEVRQKTGANVYVPPAAGDSGQCLGNVILGHKQETGTLPKMSNIIFIGPEYNISRTDVEELAAKVSVPTQIATLNVKKRNEIMAQALNEGELVFWFQGRAEFGPRALGARSILANPSIIGVRQKLNKIKNREEFNPFAASCIFEEANLFFEDVFDSPYMTTAFVVKQSMRDKIAAIVHKDGTCRAQIFKRDFNPVYYDLIKEYRKMSGLGMMLNTSLNGPGEPIVETPIEAIELFNSCAEVNILALNEYLLIKKGSWFTKSKDLFI